MSGWRRILSSHLPGGGGPDEPDRRGIRRDARTRPISPWLNPLPRGQPEDLLVTVGERRQGIGDIRRVTGGGRGQQGRPQAIGELKPSTGGTPLVGDDPVRDAEQPQALLLTSGSSAKRRQATRYVSAMASSASASCGVRLQV